jgi:hypothetical protein
MIGAIDYPLGVFAIALVTQCLAAYAGDHLRRRERAVRGAERTDFAVILPATLTLLGLIIGFSLSMAVSRYDQRKNYEEAEANAIGTEYVRADLLPASEGARVRDLLRRYTNQRVSFYEERNSERLSKIAAETTRLQGELWSLVAGTGKAAPTPVIALAVSGMNDVLNSQGYTQAAWWNRLPVEVWGLMGLIAAAGNLLLGNSERRTNERVLLILPLVVSVSLFLIADIDSPRGGLIRVAPQNLIAVSQSMKSP